MPWKKVKGGKYRSASGRLWTKRQIRAYKATGGFKRKPRSAKRRRKR